MTRVPWSPASHDRTKNTPDHTHVIDPRGGFQQIADAWERHGGALARKIRKARRENVVIELARDLGAWLEYFDIYRDSAAKVGRRR